MPAFILIVFSYSLMMLSVRASFCFGILFLLVRSENPDDVQSGVFEPITAPDLNNPCTDKATCAQCLRASPLCAWCSSVSMNVSHRCDLHTKLSRSCPEESLEAPQTVMSIPKNSNFSDHPTNEQEATNQPAVQLMPQLVSVQLRIGKEVEVPLEFKAAKNYPVDLYYLMDLSASMKDDKDTVAKMGTEIADIFKKGQITGNFRLGFGGFSDKTISPFIVDTAEMRRNPCAGIKEECDPPFNFKNKMKLTEDVNSFETIVKDTRVTGNTDKPESGLEAVLQAIKCKSQIGWRNISRKLIVYSSDANFHFAGDGRLGGLVEPNTGDCRMIGDELPGDDPYDYPSIGQVRAAALANNVNLIFAAAANELVVYRELSALIEGSAVGILSSNSSNIIGLIRDNYNKISSEVILTSQVPSGISLTIDAKCPGSNKFERGRFNCTGVSFGQVAQFRLRLRADANLCKVAPTGSLTVSPIGFADGLKIDYSAICNCSCEHDTESVPVDEECSLHGSKQCGVCYCAKDYSGKSCNCTGASASLFLEQCRNPDSDSQEPVCSGRGDCVCGECHCVSSRFSGAYCECDDEDCDRTEGALCSGHGLCQCGRCVCNPGYTRHDCSCLNNTDLCYSTGIGPTVDETEPCSGHGSCHCGKCLCEAGYLGDTCNDCPSCASHCQPNRDCALCRAGFTWGPLGNITKEECDARCSYIQVAGENGADDILPPNARECTYPAEDQPECVVQFWYWYSSVLNPVTNSSLHFRVYPKYLCPEPAPIAAIAGGIVGTIVFASLLAVLIWKLVVTIQDRREYAQFTEEEQRQDMRQTGANPMYRSATTSHKNPLYSGGVTAPLKG